MPAVGRDRMDHHRLAAGCVHGVDQRARGHVRAVAQRRGRHREPRRHGDQGAARIARSATGGASRRNGSRAPRQWRPRSCGPVGCCDPTPSSFRTCESFRSEQSRSGPNVLRWTRGAQVASRSEGRGTGRHRPVRARTEGGGWRYGYWVSRSRSSSCWCSCGTGRFALGLHQHAAQDAARRHVGVDAVAARGERSAVDGVGGDEQRLGRRAAAMPGGQDAALAAGRPRRAGRARGK